MINIEVDQEKLKELYLQKIDEHLQELESDVFFMNSKQLAINKIRLGKRLFHKKEVGKYMEKYYKEVLHAIQKLKERVGEKTA